MALLFRTGLSSMAKRMCSTGTPAGLSKFRPMANRVLVERLAPEEKTKGGIIIPEKAQGKVLEATVVAVGPGDTNEDGKLIAMQVKEGDRVLLPEYGGTKVIFDEKDFYVFRESDIMGKWEK